MRVEIPVFDGVEELDAVGPLEVFGMARQSGLDVTVRLVAGVKRVKAFHGLEMSGLAPLGNGADVIVVPGGAWLGGARTGVRLAVAEGVLPVWLAERHAAGAVVAGVCTGVFLLEDAGLLVERPATTHHLAMEDLRALGVRVVAHRVVDTGSVLTAGGVASGLDLALWLVEREFGVAAAGRVEELLEYRRQGGVLQDRG